MLQDWISSFKIDLPVIEKIIIFSNIIEIWLSNTEKWIFDILIEKLNLFFNLRIKADQRAEMAFHM